MLSAVLDAPPAATDSTGRHAPSGLLGEDAFDVDFVTEMKLRTWARQHHCNEGARQPDWHPIVHDEMERIDSEAAI